MGCDSESNMSGGDQDLRLARLTALISAGFPAVTIACADEDFGLGSALPASVELRVVEGGGTNRGEAGPRPTTHLRLLSGKNRE